MRKRPVHLLILVAFSAGLGHLAWRAFGPDTPADHVVGGSVATLRAPEPRGTQLYLRRVLHLPERPRGAWIQVLGYDRIEVLINGQSVGSRDTSGYAVAVLADVTSFLQAGENVLAIAAAQASFGRPPEVAVRGAYWLDAERVEAFGTQDGLWRCQTHYERGANYWFTPEFDDAAWLPAEHGTNVIRAIVAAPPGGLMTPTRGRWISPDEPTCGIVGVQGAFKLSASPRHAWLRVWSTASYRLAVNGTVIDVQEDQLSTSRRPPPVQRVYDVSQFVGSGENVVALALETPAPPPHVLVDFEAEGGSGQVYPFSTDAAWRWCANPGADWIVSGGQQWRACQVEDGDIGPAPWRAARLPTAVNVPGTAQVGRMVAELVLIVLIALLSGWLARLVDRRLGLGPRLPISPAILALVVPGLLVGGLLLAVYDPRVPDTWIWRPVWVLVAVVLVLVQWALLMVTARRKGILPALSMTAFKQRLRIAPLTALLILILMVGAYLRFHDLTAQPLTPDECTAYRATQGVFQRGYPSAVIADDTPLGIVATSELIYVCTAASELVFDNERLVMRVPPACWGVLTILVLFIAGRRMFGPWVGITAAALYALAPYCVETSQIGRYFSQLQAFALLTVYVFYRTLDAPGPLPRRGVWLTVAAFLGTYLSWEASALLAPGMILAALLHRRDRVRTLFDNGTVWLGMLTVGLVVLLQSSHRTLQQTLRLLYGSGATDVSMTKMWTYPDFDLWYYVLSASWTACALLPVAGLLGAGVLVIHHRWRKPARALLIMGLSLAFIQALLLPITTTRYAYHLLPLFLLPAAAALVALAEALGRGVAALQRPGLLAYTRSVAALLVLAALTAGSGLLVKPDELSTWQVNLNDDLAVQTTPDQEGATRYVYAHVQPGDAVIVALPNQPHIYSGGRVDYWLQTQMALQLTLDDHRAIPIHRLSGEDTLPDLAQLQYALASHRRVWFITSPAAPNTSTNSVAASRLIRDQMEVVYEDFRTLVFLSGDQHLTTDMQQRSETSLNEAPTVLLP